MDGIANGIMVCDKAFSWSRVGFLERNYNFPFFGFPPSKKYQKSVQSWKGINRGLSFDTPHTTVNKK